MEWNRQIKLRFNCPHVVVPCPNAKIRFLNNVTEFGEWPKSIERAS